MELSHSENISDEQLITIFSKKSESLKIVPSMTLCKFIIDEARKNKGL
jgi:hypothetical protein